VGLETGQVVGLLGPNGAGKTTTFHMMIGLATPERGSIHMDEWDITQWPFFKRAAHGLNYLPQESSIFRKLSVISNMLFVLEQQTRALSKAERQKLAEELLEKLDILSLAKQRADTLSGGERRRLEIARALATSPQFLLLDEPFTGIDPISIEELQDTITDLASKGLGILISDHNVRETLRVTDHVYLMQDGKIFWEGQPDDITSDAHARKFYLGERFAL